MILETAFMCMALNIYHEAKNQSMLGQVAVGQVVMNRVEDSRFPDNVCDVVTQAVTYKGTDKPVLHKCQFSWYCDGHKDHSSGRYRGCNALSCDLCASSVGKN